MQSKKPSSVAFYRGGVAYNKSTKRREWDSKSGIGSKVSTRWDLLTDGLPVLGSCNIHT